MNTEPLVIIRVFDAPREQVWQAWTEPERMTRWWGPKDFTAPFCTNDLRVGGTYLYCMRSPEGQDYWSTGTYREIVAPERLVCTDSFADEQGNVVPASHYGMTGDFPLELLVTMTLEDVDGKTRMTLRHEGLPASEREPCSEGWHQSFDKLAESLASKETKRSSSPGKEEPIMATTIKKTPEGYHTATPYLIVTNAGKAIDYYKEAFGAQELTRLATPEGRVMHAEIKIGDSPIMLCDEAPDWNALSPQTIGGTSVSIVLYVDDVDAVVNRAVATGAKLLMPVDDQFWGDRMGTVVDPFGHKWSIATHVEDVTAEEIQTRAKALFNKKC